MSKLSSLLDIRSTESRTASLLIGIMLFGAFGHSFGGTGIEAIYFSRYGTGQLPYLYMALGVVSLVVTLTITGLLGRVRRERIYSLIPLLIAAFIFIGWGLLFSDTPILLPIMWLAKETINAVVSLIAWNSAGAACDARQGKRLFPIFSAARILGQALGGLSVGLIVERIGAHNLLLVWGGSMLMVFVFSRALMRGQLAPQSLRRKSRGASRAASFVQELQKGWSYVRKSELMLWISAVSVLLPVLYFSVALPFSKGAAQQYPSANELARFIGFFNGSMTAATFITSLLFANRLFVRWGIMNMLFIFPIIYLIGFSTLAIHESFVLLAAFRFAQMLWLAGIVDAAWQSMFSAVPVEKRDQVNTFLNGLPEQAGVLLAGGILLVSQQAFSAHQIFLVGLVTAALAAFAMFKASQAYSNALAATLSEGRPDIFTQPRGAPLDSVALRLLAENLKSPDHLMRQLAAEILSDSPRAARLLIPSLKDTDADVRIAALKGLVNTPESILALTPLLNDPQAGVRARAVCTLRTHITVAPNLGGLLEAALNDRDRSVQVEAALGILKRDGSSDRAQETLHQAALHGDVDERIAALNAIAEWGDATAFSIIVDELNDRSAPPAVRRAAALALPVGGRKAIPPLVFALADENVEVATSAALALAQFGADAESAVLNALQDAARASAALTALEHLPIKHLNAILLQFAQKQMEAALRYYELARIIPPSTERLALLNESLRARAQSEGLQAVRAIGLTADRDAFGNIADNLGHGDTSQRSNALEMLEAIPEAALLRPLLMVWESSDADTDEQARTAHGVIKLLTSRDAWLQACAASAARDLPDAHAALTEVTQTTQNPLILELFPQGEAMEEIASLPVMERVLFLRRVPLLVDLSPSDLQRVAVISSEDRAEAGEVVFEQGDAGDKMFVIVRGTVSIIIESEGVEKKVAHHGVGAVVGEMSLLSGEPRSATLLADTDVQFLCLDRKSFEGLLRERPEVSLAVMRELCIRLQNLMK